MMFVSSLSDKIRGFFFGLRRRWEKNLQKVQSPLFYDLWINFTPGPFLFLFHSYPSIIFMTLLFRQYNRSDSHEKKWHQSPFPSSQNPKKREMTLSHNVTIIWKKGKSRIPLFILWAVCQSKSIFWNLSTLLVNKHKYYQ